MRGKILVDVPELTRAQREAIEDAARERDYGVVFSSDDRALAEAREAEIIFTGNTRLIKDAPKLKWLCVPNAGAEQYLKPVLEDREGVMLSNSSGAYGVTISEHIVMTALMLMRREPEYAELVRRRGWARDLTVRSIRNSRITLLGTGDIGRGAAARFRAFGPRRITGVNRRGRSPGDMFDAVVTLDALDRVLPETDLLVMSLPETPDTRGVMDGRRLGLMPEDAFIVNVGRGSAIDEAALAAQLRAGRFAGVALDVFAHEPLPQDDPLWDCPRLLITPHVAGNRTLAYTVERIAAMFIEDFQNYCDGRPLRRRVTLGQGY